MGVKLKKLVKIMSKKVNDYSLTLKLTSAGWKSFNDKIYIPLPHFCKEYKYLMVKQDKIGEKIVYKYAVVRMINGKYEECKSFIRDISPVDELTTNGNNLDDLGNPITESSFFNTLKLVIQSKDIKDGNLSIYLKTILTSIKEEDCLDILKERRFNNNEEAVLKKEEREDNKMSIIPLFSNRKQIGKARQGLSKFIKSKYGLILRKNSHETYILDKETNCYTEVSFDELFVLVSKELGEGLINEDDLTEAIKYIADRRDPEHNIVRFKNCLFDMDKLEEIRTKKPIFTLVESPYNYNPEAKSKVLVNFLETSLKKRSDNDTQKAIKCLKQLTGYLFTSGNRLNVLPMIIGISGGGKSVFANILIAIFGKDKVADLKLQEISKDPHATSSLVNKHLNIIQDSDASSINNNSLIKQITGNDQLQVNPKYVQPFVLPPEEVPKSILIGNNIPLFTHLEPALIERFLIVEFNVKFRGEDGEDPYLLKKILADPEEIEWFIYQSLEEYKNMIVNGEDFALRKKGKETRELINKHQTPLNYLFREIIADFSYVNWDIAKKKEKSEEDETAEEVVEDYYVYTNDLKNEIISLAGKKGIDLELNSKADIPAKQMINVIRNEFDLWATNVKYESKTHNGKRYYPHLIPTDSYKDVFSNNT